MTHHSDIKQTVLRGVYEDNAGLPRSCQGKGRLRTVANALHTRRPPGRLARAGAVVILALVAFFGINFRLVTLSDGGPVAMQMQDMASQALSVASIALLSGSTEAFLPGGEPADVTEPLQVATGSDALTGRYDTILAGLGMPMADLFNLRVQTIVIDPGHGGIDPGATGPHGLLEKDVVLDIARHLRDRLARSGRYRVLLTRDEDRKMFLKERVAFAKEHRADLFISIHINSLPAGYGHLNYVETYYFGPHLDQRSLALAEKENHDSDYLMGDFREVIARIGDTLKTEESKELAASIHGRLYSNLKRHDPDLLDARAKTGPFVVLLGVEVPSVLVEISCLSNKAEETRLSQAGYRNDIANYLEKGIVDYLESHAHRRTFDRGITQHVAKQER